MKTEYVLSEIRKRGRSLPEKLKVKISGFYDLDPENLTGFRNGVKNFIERKQITATSFGYLTRDFIYATVKKADMISIKNLLALEGYIYFETSVLSIDFTDLDEQDEQAEIDMSKVQVVQDEAKEQEIEIETFVLDDEPVRKP